MGKCLRNKGFVYSICETNKNGDGSRSTLFFPIKLCEKTQLKFIIMIAVYNICREFIVQEDRHFFVVTNVNITDKSLRLFIDMNQWTDSISEMLNWTLNTAKWTWQFFFCIRIRIWWIFKRFILYFRDIRMWSFHYAKNRNHLHKIEYFIS